MTVSGMSMEDSANSAGRDCSSNQVKHMFKCYHGIPAVQQMCKKAPNEGRNFFGCPLWKVDDCGFFKWDGLSTQFSLIDKNKLLAERIEQLVDEVHKLKQLNEKGGLKGDREEYLMNELQILKEENTYLRNKVSKEKIKRARAEEELKALKQAKGVSNHGVERLFLCIVFVILGYVLVRVL